MAKCPCCHAEFEPGAAMCFHCGYSPQAARELESAGSPGAAPLGPLPRLESSSDGGLGPVAVVPLAGVVAVVVLVGWLLWPDSADRMKGGPDRGARAAARTAADRPGKPVLKLEDGIWRGESGEVRVSLQVKGFGKYLKSVMVTGSGYRKGKFEAYGVVLTGLMPIENSMFSSEAKDYRVSIEFISPTRAKGTAFLQDPHRPVACFEESWTAELKIPRPPK